MEPEGSLLFLQEYFGLLSYSLQVFMFLYWTENFIFIVT